MPPLSKLRLHFSMIAIILRTAVYFKTALYLKKNTIRVSIDLIKQTLDKALDKEDNILTGLKLFLSFVSSFL